MLEDVDWLRLVVGLFSLGLIITGILVITSERFFSLINKVFYIERTSEETRQDVNRMQIEGRYFGGVFMIVWGIIALAWALGFDFIL